MFDESNWKFIRFCYQNQSSRAIYNKSENSINIATKNLFDLFFKEIKLKLELIGYYNFFFFAHSFHACDLIPSSNQWRPFFIFVFKAIRWTWKLGWAIKGCADIWISWIRYIILKKKNKFLKTARPAGRRANGWIRPCVYVCCIL